VTIMGDDRSDDHGDQSDDHESRAKRSLES
jgi:hypothetical protein